MRGLTILVYALFIMTSASAEPFPQSSASLFSPDHTFEVVNIVLDMADKNGNYLHLTIRNIKTGESHLLLSYPRNVDVSWSPKGRWIAVSNNDAADESTCLVFDASTAKVVADLLSRVEDEDKELSSLDHTSQWQYVRCGKWLNDHTLAVTLDDLDFTTHIELFETYGFDIQKNSLSLIEKHAQK